MKKKRKPKTSTHGHDELWIPPLDKKVAPHNNKIWNNGDRSPDNELTKDDGEGKKLAPLETQTTSKWN